MKNLANTYYISDLHLGHANVIRLCNRPFASVEEMDEGLITAWNKKVHKNDTVYILGDLIYKSALAPQEYLQLLKGKKHLILGNHDKSWAQKVDLSQYFESVSSLAEINTGKGTAILCHYPLMDHRAKYHIHGHLHANVGQPFWGLIRGDERMLNAGVDVNGYQPVSLEELIENNRAFKSLH